MRAYLGTHILGSFAFNSEGKIITYRLFPKKPEEIAERIRRIRNNEVLEEEKNIVKELKERGYKEIVFDRNAQFPVTCIQKKQHKGLEILNSSFRKIAIDLRWANSQAEINEILSRVNILLTQSKLRERKTDKIIIQAVNTLDEFDKIINIFIEHLREWYGLYFPEIIKKVSSPERFLKIVTAGKAENFPEFKEIKRRSGMEFSERDLKETKRIAEMILKMIETKKSLSKYIEESVKTCAPNLSAVAGPLLAARLLSLAGGLDRISRLPSSTIQLLGAEKALFRHLRGKGKPPKHGIIFGHPLVQKARKENKGKVARLVAAKLSIAARMDRFSGKDMGEKLKQELEKDTKKFE